MVSVRSLTLLVAAAVLGCRYRADPVPMVGPHPEIEALGGRWDGGYSGLDSRRSGSISFDVTAHGDSTFGDVLMRVAAEEMVPRPVDLAAGHQFHARSAELLTIRFVIVTGGQLRGELEPYIAPDCQCVARTTFEGIRTGDTIRGSFVTILQSGITQRGDWWAVRSDDPLPSEARSLRPAATQRDVPSAGREASGARSR